MYSKLLGEQGQCSSESTPLDPPIWLWFEFQRQRHLWVEFAAASLPCSINFFAVHLDFSLSHKPMFPNSTTIWQDNGWRITTCVDVLCSFISFVLNIKDYCYFFQNLFYFYFYVSLIVFKYKSEWRIHL